MKDKWRERYKKERIVQWDNTNIKLSKLGNADMQRTIYSNYYSSNCSKGGGGVTVLWLDGD